MHVADNLSDHLVGNVYVMFEDEQVCATALTALAGRFYAGQPIRLELSPVTDFEQARCRKFDEATCDRGAYCNFLHSKPLGRQLRRMLDCDENGRVRERRRSRSPGRRRRRRSRSRERPVHRGESVERAKQAGKIDDGMCETETGTGTCGGWVVKQAGNKYRRNMRCD
eukprot:TRINITY_DN6446_c0_g1_i1.p3 TRINITY_DN6446_c0_g1~~TRINITY_DN6446_c0_g1_i1.p3  ORF type:complete len:168 (-),score=15.04 TRINITY_DN6446_c0_g1_i1:229-732(-)